MKKKLTVLVLGSFLAIACDNANRVEASKEAPRQRADTTVKDHVEVENKRGTAYTCSVHPEVLKEVPGACPICQRTLVEARE